QGENPARAGARGAADQRGPALGGRTMTPAAAREAATLLWSCWQAGRRLPGLPEACRPVTRSEGYLVQSEVLAVSARRGLGWKIAATSAAGQAHIGVHGPLAGRLL